MSTVSPERARAQPSTELVGVEPATALVVYDPAAAAINAAHEAFEHQKWTVVEHAVRCGQLLIEQKECIKERVGHGAWCKWIEDHCDFSQSTANLYMKAARNPNALGKSTAIRHLYLPRNQIEEEDRERDRRNFARYKKRERKRATSDVHTVNVPPGVGDANLIAFFKNLRHEITSRREANKAERAKRNWNVDAVLKVELVKLLDWIESELDRVSRDGERL